MVPQVPRRRTEFLGCTAGPLAGRGYNNLEDLPEEFLRQVLQRIEAQAAALKAKQL